ncbi:hypothetical protein [Nonomuraea endophytica]|uniref:Uncharacterized protein n=1 Tax=Nonomuraea endophytica TaxID=714136 RepID=A0A7W8AHR9_9ACTN|nr:hypothetical protein [Nonomuraea endophytica]MBB5085098.1 hypothetical protein [Nonomuraea endophytica]
MSTSPTRIRDSDCGSAGRVTGGELAVDLLLGHPQADRIEGVVLALGVLLIGADPDQADERHDDHTSVHQTCCRMLMNTSGK